MIDQIEAHIDEPIRPVEFVMEQPDEQAPVKESKIAEHRKPCFYRVHYLLEGRCFNAWRVADCEKHAVELVIKSHRDPVRVIRVQRFDTRKQVMDNLPPGRSLRCVLPPCDLLLAYSLDLMPKVEAVR